MIVGNIKDLIPEEVKAEGVSGATRRVLVGPREGWDGYVMRLFQLASGGHTPCHQHDWPHINYVTHGKGILHLEGQDLVITEGSYAYVPANAQHQFRNTGETPLEFICIVPEQGEQ